MKLSEAIRLGSMMKPQAFDGWADHGTCAMNAACEAAGVPAEYSPQYNRMGLDYEGFRKAFPIALCRAVDPVTGYDKLDVEFVMFQLNDRDRWTRERIADWVEQIENTQEAKQAKPESIEVEAL